MTRLEHPVTPEELMAYVDGELQAEERSRVTEHVEGCVECMAMVTDARDVSRHMAAWEVPEAPERIADGLRTQPVITLKPPSNWWSVRRWVYGLAGGFAALFLIATITLPSLLRSRQAATAPSGTMIYPAEALTQGQQSQGMVANPTGPMVIRNVRLTIVTKEFDAARSRIDDVVRQTQGYVDHLSVRGEAGSARVLSATLRLPAAQLDAGLIELKKIGRVMEESQNSSEVTSQYVDLVARLNNARNSEQRLLGLLRERAGDLKDVVEMEREISSVREGIERMEAQQKDLNNKVQFATIQLELSEEYHAELAPPTPSTKTQLRNALVDGIRAAAQDAVDIALFVLRYGPVLLIWLVVLGSLAAVVWRLRVRIL